MQSKGTDFIAGLAQAESVVSALTAQGITVTSIVLRHGSPVIRIIRHEYCEQLVKNGQAISLSTGNHPQGQYRQGMFIQDGCKVVWSESLH
ncbi:hypothetical protein EYD79_00890 [Shigella sonnei]|nr:hypothetical protein [Escherichia coli]EFW5532192.1 hypothetical protein [Shigella sonnei]EFX7053200.1 hypothetical protein [Shigella sonnei]EFZ0655754.1 hypothetical protein [Shigella sonnei]EFZ2872797.1 hypothetical protein [Shigella sonnei]